MNPQMVTFLRKQRGFTLIEIMVAVAIMGILTAAAWPVYDRYQTKNRRTEAINALLENSSQLEKCFINSSPQEYTNCSLAITTTPRGYYTISANLGAETYTLTATPTGAQAGDAECTTLTLNNIGVRGSTGTGTAKRCWTQ